MRFEQALSSWCFLGDHYFLHTDGAISAIAELNGYDIYMATPDAANGYLNGLRALIDTAPTQVALEFHVRRRRDQANVQRFMQQPLKRQAKLLGALRRTYIEHLAGYFYHNQVFLVIQWHDDSTARKLQNLLLPDGPQRALRVAKANCQKLDDYCRRLSGSLKDMRLLPVEEAFKFLYAASHYYPCEQLPDQSYLLKEVLMPSGEERNGLYCMNGVHIKPFLMYFYPEPDLRILTDMMASLPIELDLAFYLRRRDYGAFLRKSGGDEVRQERQITATDVEAVKRLEDIAAWRRYVVDNGLQIFNNCFYLKLYGSPETLEEHTVGLSEKLSALGAIVESERLTEHAILYCLPTHMYLGRFMRQDHTEMVLSLLPAIRFNQGSGHEEALVATNFTFTGLNYANKSGGEFYHSLTIAKTGSGKGVMNCARILQLYGLGYDFYTIEIGSTYEFLFRLLGGDYVAIDPDKSVINPFPLCSEVGKQLSSALVAPTVRSLARILTDGKSMLSVHQIAVCEMAIKRIYTAQFIKKHNIAKAPTLAHFYLGLGELASKSLNDEQKRARDGLLVNVGSFLDTIIGERFKEEDNLSLNAPLFGADFKKLKDEPQLLITYLTFLSLRYGQKALFRRAPTFIVIDELHEFIRVDKETIRTLCAQIARMGRKESGYISLITQEVDDIAALDPALINQMFITNLLYTESRHEQARKHFPALNDRAYAIWRSYQQAYEDHRAAMLGFGGRWQDVFLTYPRAILALADTRSEMLTLKEQLMQKHQDMQDAYQELLERYA